MAQESRTNWIERILGVLLFLVGAVLAAGGGYLVALGGSPYYALVGLALALSGGLLFRRDPRAIGVFAIAFVGTIVWSIYEVGFDFWPAVPRIGPFLVMGAIMAFLAPRLLPARKAAALWVGIVQLGLCGAGFAAMFINHGVVLGEESSAMVAADAGGANWQWRSYGGSAGGGHFAPFSQINPDNVSKLQVAWTFRTGEINDTPDMEATPIQIDDNLYFCTARNHIFSLNAETGRKNWDFDPKVVAKGTWNRCRGVSHYEQPAAAGDMHKPCAKRIIATTVDARLFALDATNGQLCQDFGQGGIVNLATGMGEVKPGWYYPTSAPLVARGRVIVGGWVSDNQSLDEPSGVVRAFDAVTGKLVWAWDAGARSDASGAKDSRFTRSTPNFWGTATFDESLGYIFVPTGNGTSDHWGGARSKSTDAVSTSVIALDVNTGKLIWKFQAVHHDLWDWDLSAPPTFVDMPMANGSVVPALVQVGKSGQIYVLNRRTGQPLTKVVERRVPQGVMPGDHLSPTQPYSVEMPQVIPQTFSEKTMWGATFFDQMVCRIAYRKLHYAGQYTPPSLQDTAISPGYLGGMNWGGVAIDPLRKILFVNDIRVATIVRLIKRADIVGKLQDNYSHADFERHEVVGAPYAVELRSFNSPLGLPCEQPPWGKVTAIDLKTRKIVWQRSAGSVAEQTANMLGVEIPFKLGMPTISSGVMTASGLTFYAGANDPIIRAWSSASGKELWRARLPVGSQATPMSYMSGRSKRQFVVVVAGGTPYSKRIGDYVVAYALPSASIGQ